MPSLNNVGVRAAGCLVLGVIAGCGTTNGAARTPLVSSLIGTSKPADSTSRPFIAALQGGVIGQAEGLDLGNSDRQRALEAEYRALEAAPGGQPVIWEGRAARGTVVSAAPYQVGSQNCRQYRHTVTADGRDVVARGAACRNANGTWTPLT